MWRYMTWIGKRFLEYLILLRTWLTLSWVMPGGGGRRFRAFRLLTHWLMCRLPDRWSSLMSTRSRHLQLLIWRKWTLWQVLITAAPWPLPRATMKKCRVIWTKLWGNMSFCPLSLTMTLFGFWLLLFSPSPASPSSCSFGRCSPPREWFITTRDTEAPTAAPPPIRRSEGPGKQISK